MGPLCSRQRMTLFQSGIEMVEQQPVVGGNVAHASAHAVKGFEEAQVIVGRVLGGLPL